MSKFTIESEIFKRGVADIITRAELEKLLKSGRQLRVKHGIDATGPFLHIGHAANLWVLRRFQEAGHKAVIVLGDFTTRIGDPTGKLKARTVLSGDEVERNLTAIKTQIEKILLTDAGVYEVRRNSGWWGEMSLAEFMNILTLFTHARLIERDMFQERIKSGSEILVSEFLYPILQGYDSVATKSDLTIIGSDQIFNEHMGRFLQEKFNQPPQVMVALNILPGLSGREKMSKSSSDFLGLLDSPQDKFGKIMSIPDKLIMPYLESYTDVAWGKIELWKKKLEEGLNPMEVKMFLAESLVARYHGEKTAKEERKNFKDVFSKKEMPSDPQTKDLIKDQWSPLDLLVSLKLAASRSEARVLLRQGAVEMDGKVMEEKVKKIKVITGSTFKVGKRRFVKIGRIG